MFTKSPRAIAMIRRASQIAGWATGGGVFSHTVGMAVHDVGAIPETAIRRT